MIAVSPKKYAIMNADHELCRMHPLHNMTVCRRYWVSYAEYRYMKREPYESGKLSERIRENFKYLTGEGRGSVGLPAAPPVSA